LAEGKGIMLQTVLYEDGILHLTLDRPSSLNALNRALLDKLKESLLSAGRDSSIRAILLTGNGRAFCAGADITELENLDAQTGLEFATYGQAVFRLLEELGKPSLAAVHGMALGGGCELAMAATLRIAADNAVFGQPEIRLGVMPGFGGTQRLARLAGKGRALEWCLTGKKIDAQTALSAGLVSEVVPPQSIHERGIALLSAIVKLAPLAVRSIMAAIHRGYDLSLDEALAFEAAHFGLCCATHDKQEGVKAFLEKRNAVFEGE
jgi:enoyl-CoA hydratase